MAVDFKMKLIQFVNESTKTLGLEPPRPDTENKVANFFSDFQNMTPEKLAQQVLKGLVSGFDPTRSQNPAMQVINKILGLDLTGQPEESKSQRIALERQGSASASNDEEEERAADEKIKQAKKQIDQIEEDDKKQLQELQKSMKAFEDQPIPGDSKGTTTKEALEQREIRERAAGSSELEKQRIQQGSDTRVAEGGYTGFHTGAGTGTSKADVQAIEGEEQVLVLMLQATRTQLLATMPRLLAKDPVLNHSCAFLGFIIRKL